MFYLLVVGLVSRYFNRYLFKFFLCYQNMRYEEVICNLDDSNDQLDFIKENMFNEPAIIDAISFYQAPGDTQKFLAEKTKQRQ